MAGLTPYKSDQGYWTRIFSAIGFGAVAAYTAAWVYEESAAWFNEIAGESLGLYRGAAAGAVILLSAIVIYWLIYVKPRSSEFLIATEGEMRKVNWSTRKEVIGSTWVVIAISALIALILMIADITFSTLGTWVGLLESGTG